MKISFSPCGFTDPSICLSLERTASDRLRINGELFNFSPLDEGDIIPSGAMPCEWILGPVSRIDGEICLTLLLPHGSNPEAHMAFPEPIIDPPTGPIDLPFSTWSETSKKVVEGGIELTTTTHRWQLADEISVEFIPDPVIETLEEPENVDA